MDRPRARSLKADPLEAGIERRARWDAGCQVRCLLTAVHPERGLSRALVHHLSHEMPDIEFTLRELPNLSAVWVCGYEQGAAELVRRVRERFPHAFLVVTGRGPIDRWSAEVEAVGADYACGWPVPYALLCRVLHRRRVGPLLEG